MTRPVASPTRVNGATSLPMPDRFWSKVDRTDQDGCWPWLAYTNGDGYGVFNIDNRTPVRAHRVAYELLVGPIPDGLTLDHLCRNWACCNPAHLEPVPNRTNVLRGIGKTAANAAKSVCKRGHPFAGENLHITEDGKRRCRACHALWRREKFPSRAAAIAAAYAGEGE